MVKNDWFKGNIDINGFIRISIIILLSSAMYKLVKNIISENLFRNTRINIQDKKLSIYAIDVIQVILINHLIKIT